MKRKAINTILRSTRACRGEGNGEDRKPTYLKKVESIVDTGGRALPCRAGEGSMDGLPEVRRVGEGVVGMVVVGGQGVLVPGMQTGATP